MLYVANEKRYDKMQYNRLGKSGLKLSGGYMLAAAHSDSPTFKLKEQPEKLSAGHYVQLSTEKYGGMLMGTWLDRPLSAAGRVLVRQGEKLAVRLVDIDRDLLVIPNVAIHMNREANSNMKYNFAVDMQPLYGEKGGFRGRVARAAGAAEEDLLTYDLFLYNPQSGVEWGNYISAPRLDDLQCAFASLQGFLTAEESRNACVYCLFDNEEVGSETKQGAASPFLRDTLRRIARGLGLDEEAHQAMLARSFLVSADNAHAQHPNHPEYSDSGNCPFLNEGIVIKFNANQRYATDGISCALFREVCRLADAPVQTYANRSDLPGGSTLGSIANTKVPVNTVDIGLPQLAMHSAVETAGVEDLFSLVRAMTCYFSKTLVKEPAGIYCLK